MANHLDPAVVINATKTLTTFLEQLLSRVSDVEQRLSQLETRPSASPPTIGTLNIEKLVLSHDSTNKTSETLNNTADEVSNLTTQDPQGRKTSPDRHKPTDTTNELQSCKSAIKALTDRIQALETTPPVHRMAARSRLPTPTLRRISNPHSSRPKANHRKSRVSNISATAATTEPHPSPPSGSFTFRLPPTLNPNSPSPPSTENSTTTANIPPLSSLTSGAATLPLTRSRLPGPTLKRRKEAHTDSTTPTTSTTTATTAGKSSTSSDSWSSLGLGADHTTYPVFGQASTPAAKRMPLNCANSPFGNYSASESPFAGLAKKKTGNGNGGSENGSSQGWNLNSNSPMPSMRGGLVVRASSPMRGEVQSF
ncbi:hypothetical protein M011DRAFT_96175 [Sporormia fimetaria CBS 119925]|uniref:Uncharacterized protein n=1 Tax=Sporormia fimetaria CBS 119925 TaxID=1340428 RepID=A0A6A6V823_9PLEO|nr:hypothetical protein M011DRAFT_96175 [Sporormia fimetaria CBS 119925]